MASIDSGTSLGDHNDSDDESSTETNTLPLILGPGCRLFTNQPTAGRYDHWLTGKEGEEEEIERLNEESRAAVRRWYAEREAECGSSDGAARSEENTTDTPNPAESSNLPTAPQHTDNGKTFSGSESASPQVFQESQAQEAACQSTETNSKVSEQADKASEASTVPVEKESKDHEGHSHANHSSDVSTHPTSGLAPDSSDQSQGK